MSHGSVRILLIEDNPGDARLVRELLQEVDGSYEFRTFSTLADGLRAIEQDGADVALLDLGISDTPELQGLEQLVNHHPTLPVIVLTGLDSQAIGFAAVRRGAQDYLPKESASPHILQRTINYAIERQRLKSQLQLATYDLKLSEKRLRQIVEENSDGMLIISGEGLVRFINPAAEALLGRSREKALNQPFGYPLGESGTSELRLLQPGGREVVCELHQVATEWHGEAATIASLRDITDRRRLENQVRNAQKMESLGNLTRGVAHDFNNALTAIIGYASVLELNTREHPELAPSVRQILAAADRASELTRALLSFSRTQGGEMQTRELLEVLTRVAQILPSLLGSRVDLVAQFAPAPLKVTVDAAQLEQVLFNLAVNARHAMPEGGTLTLRTERLELGQEFRQQHGFGRPGSYARILVSDTGIGIAEEIREKIFEPFFTTRDTGGGTGLGLAIAYGIVKQHRGYILCHSTPGIGSTFEVLLPLTSGEKNKDGHG